MRDGSRSPAEAAGSLVVHVIGDAGDAVRLAPVYAALADSAPVAQVALAIAGVAALWQELLEGLGRGLDATVRAVARPAGPDTAAALVAAGSALPELRPAVVLVAGASDAVLGWALAAAKQRLPVVSAEAGLRDFDWGSGSEINRVLVDTIADTLFAPTLEAAENLARAGIDPGRVHHAGSTAVDAARRLGRGAEELAAWSALDLERGAYVLAALAVLGEPEAEDEAVARITESLAELARRHPVVLALDERGHGRLAAMGDLHRLTEAGVRYATAPGYLARLSLERGAGAVVTDTGIVQDETSALGIPCFTLRAATERMITVTHGTNVLLGPDARELAELALARGEPVPSAIPRWDGRAAERIAEALVAAYALAPVRHAS